MQAKIRELEKGLFLIDDAGESTCYVLCGSTGAALIDTLNGAEDLREIVEGLTNLPVTVINTHGHCDHIAGNIFFDEAWIHPADEELANEHFSFMGEIFEKFGKKPCPFRYLSEGQVFDLGGVTLEVLPMYGHTAGSVALLCREKRLLFTGDGMNPHIWMQLSESLPIRCLRQNLMQVKEKWYDQYDRVLYGHAVDYMDKTILDQLLLGCDQLLSGQRQQDREYLYFDGQARALQHLYGEREQKDLIVYTEDKL